MDGPAFVFVSYCREDEVWRQRFETMLAPVVRERQLEVWSDQRLLVGERWRPQLDQAIARSRVALLLVSADFLASKFIMDSELPALSRAGTLLLPVLIRPCLWKQVPVLADIQWAHDPKLDGPVKLAADPEGEIVRVCERVLDVVRELTAPVAVAPAVARSEAVPALDRGSQRGALDGVPLPPSSYVVRDEIASVRDALLRASDGSVAITALGLQGEGGIGKTVLAAALARDDDVRAHFPDGIYWVTVGERGDLVAAQLDLLERLGVAHPELRSSTQGLSLLREALAERRCLLVIDDVWSRAAAEAFRAAGPAGRVLYTTRDATVLPPGADVERIDVLSETNARELLTRVSGVPLNPATTTRILDSTGRATLALALVAAAVGPGNRTWEAVADQLEDHDRTFLRHPYANAFKAMRVAMASLDDDLAAAYRSLAAYPEDTVVPVAAVTRLWGTDDTEQRLQTLAARKLLILEPEGFHFHDLQRDFLLLDAGELTLVHADLLAAYDRSALSHDEPYIWEHLVHHLRGAGDATAIHDTVTDLAFLAVRTFRGGPHQTLNDLEVAAALPEHGPAIDWLVLLFRQWGHLLVGHESVAQLAVTLSSRIIDPPPGLKSLEQLLPPIHLAPAWGMPMASRALARVLDGHDGEVTTVAFSPDGRRLASGGVDATVRLWEIPSGRPLAVLEGHTDEVTAVAFAPGGDQLASASEDETVRLWDTSAGASALVFAPGAGIVSAVAFAPDGRSLISGTIKSAVHTWDISAGLQRTLSGHTAWVQALAYSPGGRWWASGDRDGTIRVWDRDGVFLHALKGHTDAIDALAAASDGRRLASCGRDGVLRLWDADAGRLIATFLDGAEWITSVAFSPDGSQVATAGYDGVIRLWDADSGRPNGRLEGHHGGVGAVGFSPCGRWIASGSHDGTVRLWDAQAADATSDVGDGGFSVGAIALAPDGLQVATTSDDGQVRLSDVTTGDVASVLEGRVEDAWRIAFSPDGARLASGSNAKKVHVWDARTGRTLATLEPGGQTIALSPDGRQIASPTEDGDVRVWEVPSARPRTPLRGRTPPLATFSGHSRHVMGIVFSADGLLATADHDGTVRLWDVAGATLKIAVKAHSNMATEVAFAPGRPLLASGGGEGTIKLFNTGTGAEETAFERHEGWVLELCFSADGRTLVSGSMDGGVRVWDVIAHRPLASLDGHTARIDGIVFSPDGRWLATAGGDGSLRLWNTADWSPASHLRLGGSLHWLAWGPHGITTSAHSGLVQVDVVTPGG